MLNLKSQCSLLHSHVNHRYSGNVRGLALFLDIYRAYNKFNKTTEGHQTDVILNFSHDFWVFGIARLQEFTAGWVSIKVHSYHVDLSENMAPLSIQSLIIILIAIPWWLQNPSYVQIGFILAAKPTIMHYPNEYPIQPPWKIDNKSFVSPCFFFVFSSQVGAPAPCGEALGLGGSCLPTTMRAGLAQAKSSTTTQLGSAQPSTVSPGCMTVYDKKQKTY
jgi:hypothetical protein